MWTVGSVSLSSHETAIDCNIIFLYIVISSLLLQLKISLSNIDFVIYNYYADNYLSQCLCFCKTNESTEVQTLGVIRIQLYIVSIF